MPEVDVLIDSGSITYDKDPFAIPGAAYDFRIAGLNFISACTPENPMERAFARVSKEMVNTSPQPGDASLDGWWIRSATDWSGGAGYEFMEPIDKDPIPTTFHWSYGVNVWREGQLSLLPQPFDNTGFPVSRTTAQMAVYRGYVYTTVDNRIFRVPANEFAKPNNVIPSSREWMTLPSSIVQLVVGQGMLLASTQNDGVYALQTDSATSKQVFTSAKGTIRLWYVKERFILASGNSLYEQVITNINTPVALDAPFVSSPELDWQWLAVSATPAAILVAGRGQEYSAVSAVTLDDDGVLPTLKAPVVVAEFPQGEVVRDIRAYLGTFLLISTSSGVRLGVVGDQGQVSYGPLLGCGIVTGPFSVYDRFAFAPVEDAGEGRSGLVRFDLSKVTEDQKVPWAYDIRTPPPPFGDPPKTWQVRDMRVLSDGVIVMMTQSWRGVKLCSVQPGCDTEPFGVLQSGQIRMGSTVPKSWARLSLSTQEKMRGGVRAEIVVPSGTYRIGDLTNPKNEIEWSFNQLQLTSVHAAVRLTLARGAFPDVPIPPMPPPEPPSPEPPPNPIEPGPEPGPGQKDWNTLRAVTWQGLLDSLDRWQDIAKTIVTGVETGTPDATSTPIVEGWALRGTPAIPRTELIRTNVLCFDQEVDNQGQRVGADGQSIQRYRELVKRLAPNETVQFVDLNNGYSEWVSVDEMSYRQVAAPTRGSGFGGVIDLVMRVS